MDALRYWVIEMHVDGFRFDLASILGRDQQRQCPGQPADGRDDRRRPGPRPTPRSSPRPGMRPASTRWAPFPPITAGPNGTAASATMSGPSCAAIRAWSPALATRIAGSSDLYQQRGRRPCNSINFITSHDGFTLADLVSYNEKHNLANGEDNRDGDNNNISWNSGVEGAPVDRRILALRLEAHAHHGGHPAALPGGADAGGRRRIRPQPAGQQQRLVPGQRNELAGLVAAEKKSGAVRVFPAAHRPAPGASGLPPP